MIEVQGKYNKAKIFIDNVEEKTLSQSLGKPYQDYMTRTHRLLPFLY